MIHRRPLLLSALAAAACTVSPSDGSTAPGRARDARNQITLTDASASSATNYPARIGRPFMRGEITGSPQAVIGGQRLATQADIKTRWPDGSVQHAVLSFVVPRIPALGSATVSFVNGTAGAAAPLSAAQMLAPEFDFDAVLEVSANGQTQTASARKMLQSGDFTVWCQGPVATTIILADHSQRRAYDLGFDNLRSIRPIFHATFWPGIGLVQVRVIAENANTEAMQDVSYAATIRLGMNKPRDVFHQALVTHYGGTRWTRAFALGAAPTPSMDIDHNLAYLAATRALPNYDTSLEVPEAEIGRFYAIWSKLPRNLYDASGWTQYMPSTGGRNDLGPNPEAVTKWLFTGDHRLFEMVSVMAEQAAAWPLHAREGNPAKRFDAARTVPALGHPVSIFARPSVWLFDARAASRPEDAAPVRGDRLLDANRRVGGGWISDGAHQPDPFSALYLLTGDYYALEETQFWAAVQALSYDPVYRGPSPSGAFMDQVRGSAWVLRNRVNAAWLTPDAMPEKAYFATIVDHAIALWEGIHDIRGTASEGTPLWRYGQERKLTSPLHFFAEQAVGGGEGFKPGAATTASALWQNYMLIFELGRSEELGFATGRLTSWLGHLLTSQFSDPAAYSPYNIQRYWTPVRGADRAFLQSWAATLPIYVNQATPEPLAGDACDGYGAYAYGASTVLVREPGGAEAFGWLKTNMYDRYRPKFAACPKWALKPRA